MSNNPNTTNPLNTNNKKRKMSLGDGLRAVREASHAARLEGRGKKWTADPLDWWKNANALRGEEE